MTAPSLPFYKMNGAGNSILVVDLRASGLTLSPSAARALAAMPELAFDQLMAIGAPRAAATDAFVEIFNGDGSRAGACGNGTRCVAWVLGQTSGAETWRVQTAGGELLCRKLGPTTFSVDMGPPRLEWQDIPLAVPVDDTTHVALPHRAGLAEVPATFSAVSMGNPHAVFFVEDVAAVRLEEVGPLLEHDPLFPERANISFAEVGGRDRIALRVWERSAGATLACGSAACATLVAAVRAGLTERRAAIMLPGGTLTIEWREADRHVVMTGEVELEHAGTMPPERWAAAA